ncbi:alanine racemase [Candidatus Liberibacter africanus]|uniref:Alanine racemase n=1 Tax=Candidatus Liberibacter africanus PTSAPSY TaxID=1277257 RepID=A0A0G3I3X1_LIBAF|nr:alanine racemase [Candidatus Liberibacter africanus]AKK19900.1 alanine racemase [Candidatus Liberibacter africanus PTSAPSY]QTP63749.1 alanine racemase [Candidatus Liberibacter africanus]
MHSNEFLKLTIDLTALKNNWHSVNQLSGSARTAAVVKDDAYGLGLEKIAIALYNAGAQDFFVTDVAEGVKLRSYLPKAKIFVLYGINPGEEKHLFNANLIPVISSISQLSFYGKLISSGVCHPYALQVDTGFNRLGLSLEEALDFAQNYLNKKSDNLSLIMSHLACADDPKSHVNSVQLKRFRTLVTYYKGVEASLVSSAGILLGSDYHFQLTRPGISLYGGTHTINKSHPMETVVTAEARIIQIRKSLAGEIISYGGGKKLTRNSLIAVASIGYADGYPLTMSRLDSKNKPFLFSGGEGFVKGYTAPVLGKITMDMTMFDITDSPGIKVGDYIQVFGSHIKLDDVAVASGTTNYDLLVRIGKRYAKFYR